MVASVDAIHTFLDGGFDPVEDGTILEEDFGIPLRYVQGIMSPWAVKRLHEYGGDISFCIIDFQMFTDAAAKFTGFS